MPELVAETKLFALRPNGDRVELFVRIGKPYECGRDPESWACPVSIPPFYDHLHDIVGGDAFHALCMGTSFALEMLHGLTRNGTRIMLDETYDFPFDAYAFLGKNAGPNGV